MLLFTLTLLPTAPIVAKGPKPPEPTGKANVTVSGDITGDGKNLNVYEIDKKHALVIVRGDVELTFQGIPGGLWWNGTYDFAGDHEGKLWIRMDERAGETEIFYEFGTSDFEDKGWPKYRLMGPGEWSSDGTSIPYGTVTAVGPFTIDEMYYARSSKKEGKGAIGIGYDEVWSGSLLFEIRITPPPP